ncbi:MAG: tungstate ABC transporter substrate-binding protein WtpA [Bacteroidales bacterium]
MKRIISILFLLLTLSACIDNKQETLVIFHAGSLSLPLKAIADSFTAENPNVHIQLEAAGSVECARKITELNRRADIIASADYRIINDMLIPQHANWNILFASNEMALVFTRKSRFANEINKDNWFEILQHKSVHHGRSDPNADPCGYRTLLTLQLAEKYYNKPNIAKNISEKDRRFIRPKEVDLIALLESGAIDYIFLYRSVAVQHGLEYLTLPKEMNLGATSHADFYQNASVTIRGSSPNDSLTIQGEPMVYGITIPKNAPNKELAEKFIKYFTNRSKGLKTIKSMGMPLVWPMEIHGRKEMVNLNEAAQTK